MAKETLAQWRERRSKEMHSLEAEKAEREARKKEEERVFVEQSTQMVLTLRQGQEEWSKIVYEPSSPAEVLRRVIVDETRSWFETGLVSNVIATSLFESIRLWHLDFHRTVASHPNLPSELFGRDLEVNEDTVFGLLRNSALPLVLLENPDFIERLERESEDQFSQLVLQNEMAPPALLGGLKVLGDTWLTLEAQTHIASEDPDVPVLPDFDWLDAQIISRLRGDPTSLRCLIYELVCHGLLPKEIGPVTPWQSSTADTDTA
ncbi:MAG: hypothetical protein QM758_07445 [Armatimonas sp.]